MYKKNECVPSRVNTFDMIKSIVLVLKQSCSHEMYSASKATIRLGMAFRDLEALCIQTRTISTPLDQMQQNGKKVVRSIAVPQGVQN
jgi:hypothetical protein